MEDHEKFEFTAVTLTELMTLYGMDEEAAVKIKELIDTKAVSSFDALGAYDFISVQHHKLWSQSFR